MAIYYSTLRQAATRPQATLAKTINEAQSLGVKTAFLCHSHVDKTLVEGFENYVRQKGWRIYIDWLDTSMPDKPNRTTANKIKAKIETTNIFIFLATRNSMTSRWCPWAIGYADGVKQIDDILVVPTIDDSLTYHGSEYLQLYRKLDVSAKDRFAVWAPGAEMGTAASSLY